MLPLPVDAAHPSNNPPAPLSPLDQFRAKTRRLTIHPLEQAALWLIGTHLVFLPWALGTMRPLAQSISFALAVIGFIVSLLPRNYTEEHTGSNRFRLLMWPKLVRFPIFWLGLALLGLIVVQALNPAWAYVTDGSTWHMTGVPHRAWLPSGVKASFELWDQWRMLLIYASAWLTVCTVWVALTRRRSIQLLLIALAANGLLLGAFGVGQRLLKTPKMFGFFQSPNPSFFSSFIYKNHGGAYLLLMLIITAGLAGWYYLRGLRRLEKSNPSGVLVFFATCIAVSILTSYARGATVVMLGFLVACIVAFVLHQISLPSESRKPVIAIVLVLVFGFFLKVGLGAVRSNEAWDKLRQGITYQDVSRQHRERVTAAALEMLGEKWHLGVGAGSFRFIFPIYQHRHPELTKKEDGSRMFWEHAHNDIVQFPIELGLPGMLIVLAGFGFWGLALIRSYFWENPLSACVVFGLFLLMVYAWWDFPFQCPAVLITWCTLWAAAVMWARMEESGVKG